jgi:hypothetical protein
MHHVISKITAEHIHVGLCAAVGEGSNCGNYRAILFTLNFYMLIKLLVSSLDWHQRSWVALNASVSPIYNIQAPFPDVLRKFSIY